MLASALWVIAGCTATPRQLLQDQPPPQTKAAEERPTTRRIRKVEIRTRNIYSDAEADNLLLYRVLNALHWPTEPDFVRRELWFLEGDSLDQRDAEEIERRLRRRGIFGEVDVELRDVEGKPDEVDLAIDTRDRMTLRAAFGASTVGGVTRLTASAGEFNLFGTAKSAAFEFREAEDERVVGALYRDQQFLGTWHDFILRGGNTEEGPFGFVSIERPFHFQRDPTTYGGRLSYQERDVDYFRSGESEGELAEDRVDASAFIARGWGPWTLRRAAGVRVAFQDARYGPPSINVRQPGDTRSARLQATLQVNYTDSFEKIQRLDAIDFEEDLWLGCRWDIAPGIGLRDEKGAATEVQPVLSSSFRLAFMPGRETFVTTEFESDFRWHGSGLRGWQVEAALHAFQLSLPSQTLAANLTYRRQVERQGLEPQLTLGEDNGLRGYPAREFTGDEILQLNFENRIDSGLELLSVHFGVVAFFDAAMVRGDDQRVEFDQIITSTGVGLRFGSSNLMGANVFRIDVGFPLTTVDGDDFGLSISVASGQVFRYFGSSQELRAEF